MFRLTIAGQVDAFNSSALQERTRGILEKYNLSTWTSTPGDSHYQPDGGRLEVAVDVHPLDYRCFRISPHLALTLAFHCLWPCTLHSRPCTHFS